MAFVSNQQIENQPPKKIITLNALIRIIEPYSAKKNKAKPIAAHLDAVGIVIVSETILDFVILDDSNSAPYSLR